MERIKHELTGYKIPSYVEEVLTRNYCPGFIRMNMVKENGNYSFSYSPGIMKNIEYSTMSMYEKLILIRSLITVCEKNKEHLINPETYLMEPELIYSKDGNVSTKDIRIMYYPDIKSLNFRYKLVLFADRVLNKRIGEEKDALDQIRQASETGSINRIKLYLDKQISRIENSMAEGRIFS